MYYPPVAANEFLCAPFSRKCCGRGVNSSAEPALTLMWTQLHKPTSMSDFQPNHFVPLLKKDFATNPPVIELDKNSDSDIESISDPDPADVEISDRSYLSSSGTEVSELAELESTSIHKPKSGTFTVLLNKEIRRDPHVSINTLDNTSDRGLDVIADPVNVGINKISDNSQGANSITCEKDWTNIPEPSQSIFKGNLPSSVLSPSKSQTTVHSVKGSFMNLGDVIRAFNDVIFKTFYQD